MLWLELRFKKENLYRIDGLVYILTHLRRQGNGQGAQCQVLDRSNNNGERTRRRPIRGHGRLCKGMGGFLGLDGGPSKGTQGFRIQAGWRRARECAMAISSPCAEGQVVGKEKQPAMRASAMSFG